MDFRKLMLGFILLLGVISGYVVSKQDAKWPFEFKLGLDIQGGMHLVLQAQATHDIKVITPDVMSAAIAVVRARVDGLGVAEPLIQPKGADQIIVDLPGISDKDEALRILGKTAILTFRARKGDFPEGKPAPQVSAATKPSEAPGGSVSTPSPSPTTKPSDEWLLTGVEGRMVRNARVEPLGTSWAVTADFDSEGKRIIADVSRKLLGKPMAIFLDNQLISAPIVQTELNSGNIQITGNFDAKAANELMIVLRAGSLPVPLEVVENRSVDASLGAESVRASILAGIVGFVLVVLFMVAYYGIPGVIANIALVIYGLLVLAVFKMIPITLTVPGIAGFILSLGMAVDANILIFERTREELKNGRTIYAAVEIGFKRAFSAIFDSNITTLLSCAVLFYFGTGLVKGFALTLAIGVGVSMFTAITATRNLLHWVLNHRSFKSPKLFGVALPSKIR
ncbi:MAG: protein translocase subunit SecD [Candidatus Sericytochromatia bacterium]|nr:protein translocase subunit SecD [Candidatus Sericytochromatia bacterium]